MKLSEIEMSQSATITAIHGSGAFRRRLIDMGICRGTRVTMIRRAPLKDPLEISVKGYNLALRIAEADLIDVDDVSKADGGSHKKITLALAGNPNCGKTSIFNVLTGASQEVGNFPGVTVEYALGKASFCGKNFKVVDLPGTYSLTAYSMDEKVARDYLLEKKPDLILNVADASTLDRQLYLTVQLLELGFPMVIALNMADVAERRGIKIDAEKLSLKLGIPVILTNASTGAGIEELKKACCLAAEEQKVPRELPYSHELEDVIDVVESALEKSEAEWLVSFPRRWLALKLLEHDPTVTFVAKNDADVADAVRTAEKKLFGHSGEDPEMAISEARMGIASGIVMDCVSKSGRPRLSITDRIDAWACGRFTGPILLAAVVYLLFTVIFGIGERINWIPLFNGEFVSPTGLMEKLFDYLGTVAENNISNPAVMSLVRDGIIGGVGGILTYVPLIFIMFLLVAVLEDTGYIARVAFILDRLLRVFGLQGKSILAMIMSGGLGGGGCAVPGILATRTLREDKDRLITILVVPMMNCGAKFPLYVLLAGAFFAGSQGLVMFILWLLSWVFSMTAAVILRKFVIRGDQTPFIMELPVYHVPKMRGVLQHTWMRTWMYIRKAGTVILFVSVALWALMYFPGPENPDAPDRITTSYAGKIGRALEPVSRLAGFGWKENVALIGGVAAKEVVVSTLETAYSMSASERESADNAENLGARLRSADGWNKVKAFAMMIFVMLYSPCIAALTAAFKETHSIKWTFFGMIYSTVFAFVIAVAIYQIGMLVCY